MQGISRLFDRRQRQVFSTPPGALQRWRLPQQWPGARNKIDLCPSLFLNVILEYMLGSDCVSMRNDCGKDQR